ncbi:MAG: zinc ABC transporter substrate-binding protein, partial [Oscillospiraceae bacterium]|nr:zinc ABC transporter substrate-binding protein [Oscillospiraceae bacterium]
ALYRENCEAYCAEIAALDADFRALRAGAERTTLIFADRFPLLYFCESYDLGYRAAFHGCASDTEPSLATLKYLIDRVESESIPVVYTVDLSSEKIAEVISECTGAGIQRLWSLQTVSREDFAAGETYITMMRRNLAALEGGLYGP